MPTSQNYTVRRGDTLSGIAARFGTTVEALAAANRLSDADQIAVGQVLDIPAGVTVSSELNEPDPAPMTNDWAALIAKHGDDDAREDFDAGRRVVIALRSSTNTRANRGRGLYDDRIVVIRRKDGAVQAIEFAGNTEPSGQYAWDGRKPTGNDRNRDGKLDQGRLRAGSYRYERQATHFLGAPYFKCRTVQESERDTNQDGLFTAADEDRIDPTGAQRTMHVHRGGDDNTWSAGCQTIPKSRYDSFLAALGDQSAFSYVLIDR